MIAWNEQCNVSRPDLSGPSRSRGWVWLCETSTLYILYHFITSQWSLHGRFNIHVWWKSYFSFWHTYKFLKVQTHLSPNQRSHLETGTTIIQTIITNPKWNTHVAYNCNSKLLYTILSNIRFLKFLSAPKTLYYSVFMLTTVFSYM